MRTTKNLAIFLTALALCCAALGTFTPAPRVAIVSPKLAYLDSHADEFDVLFLGSSRTYRQIIPQVFDRLMAEGGHPVRSFNLGVDGMRPPEDTYVLEKALKHRTRPLKFVLVESNPLRLSSRDEDEGTIRATYWHDTKRIVTLFRRAFLADRKKRDWPGRIEKIAEQMPDFAEHAACWLENTALTGRGHEQLDDWLVHGGPPPLPMHDVGPLRDGYKPSSEPEQMHPSIVAAYEAAVTEMIERTPRADYADPVSQAEILVKRRLIERHGGQMFLVIPPFTSKKFFHPEPGAKSTPVLEFSDPAVYPDLFATKNHSDTGHVNRAGSELYTRHIVRELLKRLSR